MRKKNLQKRLKENIKLCSLTKSKINLLEQKSINGLTLLSESENRSFDEDNECDFRNTLKEDIFIVTKLEEIFNEELIKIKETNLYQIDIDYLSSKIFEAKEIFNKYNIYNFYFRHRLKYVLTIFITLLICTFVYWFSVNCINKIPPVKDMIPILIFIIFPAIVIITSILKEEGS